MKSDNRLWRMVHVLLHMSQQQDVMTSADIAEMLKTHPVVVRRTMAGLREKNIVKSDKGHGGGWRLSCSLDQITVLDIYLALGSPEIFALGSASSHPGCRVEKAVNRSVGNLMNEARILLLEGFANLRLSQIEAEL